MNELNNIAKNLNILIKYLAKRDIPSLNKFELEKKFNIKQADILIIFGGSILYACDIAAKAYKEKLAKNLLIVGGIGHATKTFQNTVSRLYPSVLTNNRSEADIIADYMNTKYGINDFIIENKSTNSGNNVIYAGELLAKNKIYPDSAIIIQDSTMQQRMDATLKKSWFYKKTLFINYAPYIAEIIVTNNSLAFKEPNIFGIWDFDKFIELLMGEIPRLTDDINGYGPKGSDFIISVDIPNEVLEAFEYLKNYYSSFIRKANKKYKSL